MCAENNASFISYTENSPFLIGPAELEDEMDEFLDYEFNEAYDETMEELAEELGVPEDRLRDNNAIDEIVASYVDDNLTWSQVVTKATDIIKGETL
jgi:CO/xanthine dehydrogenase Mo-binding subunit